MHIEDEQGKSIEESKHDSSSIVLELQFTDEFITEKNSNHLD